MELYVAEISILIYIYLTLKFQQSITINYEDNYSLNFALTKAGKGTKYQIILTRMTAPGKAKLMAVLV